MKRALQTALASAITAALICGAGVANAGDSPSPAGTEHTSSICVWDPIGAAGPLFAAAKTYALSMQKFGFNLSLKPYTDEHVAAEDFRVGQCDGLVATSIRTRPYNAVAVSIDATGATTIVRDGKIDVEAGYEVVRKAIQIFSSPAAAKLVVQERFELGGIIPMGSLYTIARDRLTFTQGFAGKRLPAFDHDKAQAYIFQKIGAQPVSADISNFVTKFNNGLVDVIFAPAVAYQPLEIFRGVGTKGGVSRFPLAFTTMQMVFEKDRFPAGFGDKSRQYWFSAFDEAIVAVRKAEQSIPAAAWVDYPPEEATTFVNNQREMRIDLADKGFLSKPGLKILKRVRCSINPAASECATTAEIDW